MRFVRIIPKLDIKNGLLIKGINLEGLRVLGDPYNFAKYYFEQGADEICYIDNVATLYGTNNLSKFVKRTAQNIFIPLAVGGGIRSLNDIEDMLRNGADKVCINSAVIDNKNFLKKINLLAKNKKINEILDLGDQVILKDYLKLTSNDLKIIKDSIKILKFWRIPS